MQKAVTYTEAELIAALKMHDEQAFVYLYDHYSKAIFTVINSVVSEVDAAEDILQEVFLKIWQNISMYDAGKGRLFTWMINIARNRAIDCLRSKQTLNKTKTVELTDIVYNGADEMRNLNDVGLKRVLDDLPKENRKLLELAYFLGYTQEEISKILNIPIGTVKTRIRTTIIQLRKILGVKI